MALIIQCAAQLKAAGDGNRIQAAFLRAHSVPRAAAAEVPPQQRLVIIAQQPVPAGGGAAAGGNSTTGSGDISGYLMCI